MGTRLASLLALLILSAALVDYTLNDGQTLLLIARGVFTLIERLRFWS